jgi:UDP-glucose 4-epimerase
VSKLNILITGGAGYIGSHTLVELDKAGYSFVVYDNLSNSSLESVRRVEKIINKSIHFEQGDIRDKDTLKKVFQKYSIDSVIHFAGLKAVGESVSNPLEYYNNNVYGTMILLEVMKEFKCKKIVFSSSATVYGDPHTTPIKEDFPTGATTNPYGTSKYMIERILEDLYISDNTFKIVILRYFNPVGAHKSGTIGEDPSGIPNNLMPFISQTAVGKREFLSVFGGDYDTPDGTGVRDYIHVVDLADAHVKAMDYLFSEQFNMEKSIFNIGTGIGYSVVDMIKAYEKVSKKQVPYKLVARRTGDIAKCYADATQAKTILKWEATKTLEDMCTDSYRWQSNNPDGYNKVNNSGDDK